MNLAKTGYIVSDATLTDLTKSFVHGIEEAESVRGNFFKILVAHSKRALGKWQVKRATTEKALEAVTEAYDHLYAVVLDAVTTPDLLPSPDVSQEERTRRSVERNRRSTFARSAKATLVAAIGAGARLAAMDPATITKEELRRLYAGDGGARDSGTVQERVTKAETRLESVLQELAKEDIDEARKRFELMVEKCRMILYAEEAPPDKVPKLRQLTAKRKKVGNMTLHPH